MHLDNVYCINRNVIKNIMMNLNMHNSVTTNKSVVKYNIIDECCIFPQYALTKIQKVKTSHFI